jgi:hypothetical protein
MIYLSLLLFLFGGNALVLGIAFMRYQRRSASDRHACAGWLEKADQRRLI